MANHSLNLLCTLKERKRHTTQFWLSNNIRAELSCNLPLGAALKSEQPLNPFTYPLQDDTFSCCDSTGLLAARKSSNLITCPIIVGVIYHFFYSWSMPLHIQPYYWTWDLMRKQVYYSLVSQSQSRRPYNSTYMECLTFICQCRRLSL